MVAFTRSLENSGFQPTIAQGDGVNIKQQITETRPTQLYFIGKVAQILLFSPASNAVKLTYRAVKLFTFTSAKAAIQMLSGHHGEAVAYFDEQYIETMKAVRNLLFTPSLVKLAFNDMIAKPEIFVDDIPQKPIKDYLKMNYMISPQQFTSHLHVLKTFSVICPEGIIEFPAVTDPVLKTVLASAIFKPGFIGINFGTPNVSTFITEMNEDGSVQTTKTDAKSLWREKMTFHVTNGKILTGVVLVLNNLPNEALKRFKESAERLQGLKNVTCVNTNCRVLQAAGFSIEGVAMDKIVFPNELIEHLLFRNVLYTDLAGIKHKVHFGILNTTPQGLEDYFRDVDTAVIKTKHRHDLRNSDTEENKKARGEAAKALIAEQARRLAEAGPLTQVDDTNLGIRKITISVPSFLGDQFAKVWGRHTIYELDLSDKRQEIFEAFNRFAQERGEPLKLRPFPKENPSFVTRLKRDVFFSNSSIRLLRRHMMGRVDTIELHTQDVFRHLKSTEGEHLNYVLLHKKIVLARVKPNKETKKAYKEAATWALTKHRLLAGEGIDSKDEVSAESKDTSAESKDTSEVGYVYCSGEMWYDKENNSFVMDENSGTYDPHFERVKVAAELANRFFDTARFGHVFVAKSFFEKNPQVIN